MGAGWVAGSVRAASLARHRLGPDGARELAAAGSVGAARARLNDSPYAQAIAGEGSVRGLQRAIWNSVLWDLRVLAGWLPPPGVAIARAFAAFFEVQNFEDLLAHPGGERVSPFELGGLAIAWPHAQEATSASGVREQLRRSAWRDPGTSDPSGMLLGLRLEWARLLSRIEPAAAWGTGAAALVVAGGLADGEQPVDPDVLHRVFAFGPEARNATTVPALFTALPESARWALEGIEHSSELWRAEAGWWRRVEHDGERLLRAARPGRAVVVGGLSVRMADAWRTAAAVEIASRGGRGREVLDVAA